MQPETQTRREEGEEEEEEDEGVCVYGERVQPLAEAAGANEGASAGAAEPNGGRLICEPSAHSEAHGCECEDARRRSSGRRSRSVCGDGEERSPPARSDHRWRAHSIQPIPSDPPCSEIRTGLPEKSNYRPCGFKAAPRSTMKADKQGRFQGGPHGEPRWPPEPQQNPGVHDPFLRGEGATHRSSFFSLLPSSPAASRGTVLPIVLEEVWRLRTADHIKEKAFAVNGKHIGEAGFKMRSKWRAVSTGGPSMQGNRHILGNISDRSLPMRISTQGCLHRGRRPGSVKTKGALRLTPLDQEDDGAVEEEEDDDDVDEEKKYVEEAEGLSPSPRHMHLSGIQQKDRLVLHLIKVNHGFLGPSSRSLCANLQSWWSGSQATAHCAPAGCPRGSPLREHHVTTLTRAWPRPGQKRAAERAEGSCSGGEEGDPQIGVRRTSRRPEGRPGIIRTISNKTRPVESETPGPAPAPVGFTLSLCWVNSSHRDAIRAISVGFPLLPPPFASLAAAPLRREGRREREGGREGEKRERDPLSTALPWKPRLLATLCGYTGCLRAGVAAARLRRVQREGTEDGESAWVGAADRFAGESRGRNAKQL
ncbi:unnamed protein product, partial [Pleuronectes platessa]